ncbi:MAG TPA: hypothetical protein PKZ97_15255 [Azospirillaceae bacterium]|nr:hypothetical protein [Azospirillaceae bacterium]HRQ82468.1 hypothetical protein [Azospirillaceae bacterium]
MTAFAYYYLSLFFVILAVFSNRYWRSQLKKADLAYDAAKQDADKTAKEVAVVAAEATGLTSDLGALTKRADKAELEHQFLQTELVKRKQAPVERYFVFERSQPRPGAFWEVAVRCVNGEEGQDRGGRATWAGVRSYMLIADNEGAALRRAQARFSVQHGYQVVQAAPSRVAGLSMSRVEELSTYRRPSRELADAAQ